MPDEAEPEARSTDEPSAPPPASPPRWTYLHLWQIQPIRDVAVVATVVGLVLLGSRISVVTSPLLLAVLLAYLFEPLVQRLTRARWIQRRTAAALIVFGTIVIVLVPAILGLSFAGIQGARVARTVGTRVENVIASVEEPADGELRDQLTGAWLVIRDFVVEIRHEAQLLEAGQEGPAADPNVAEAEGVAGEQELIAILGVDARDVVRVVDGALKWVREHAQQLGQQALTTGRGAVGMIVATAGSVGRLLFGAFLTAFFFFFVSSGWDHVTAFVRGLLPVKNRERVVQLAGRMDHAISGFIRGRLTIAMILAAFYTLTFWLIGVPAPLVLGPAIAMLAIVPYASLLGMPVVIVLLWLEGHTGFRGEFWWALVAPIVAYNLGQALDDYLLTPLIQGDATGLDTPSILFASIAGASLMGFYGLLVAIPLAACLKVLLVDVFWPRFQDWSEGKERDFLPIDRDP